MDQSQKTEKLRRYFEKVSPGIFDDRAGGLESMATGDHEMAGLEGGLEKLASHQELTESESVGLEAIIHKEHRPAVFIRNDSFEVPPDPWTHYGEGQTRTNIDQTIPCIGRVEVPEVTGMPFGGTGFIVGPGLIMTNRHVAEIFTRGLGIRNLRFKNGLSAGLNLRKEVDRDDLQDLEVTKIEMIHPYWDMALLRVKGLSSDHSQLTLSTQHTDDSAGAEIAVIGYPAKDPRNNIALQDEIFQGTYNVKRMQPGRIEAERQIMSFGNNVPAATHDASTLGGNSGSAVVHVESGKILALHFAGLYLDANFAVPAAELAQDQRVVDAGVNFDGSSNTTNNWANRWSLADSVGESGGGGVPPRSTAQQSPPSGGDDNGGTGIAGGGSDQTVSITIPLKITVSLGTPENQTVRPNHASNMESQTQTEGLFGSEDDGESIVKEAYRRAGSSFLNVNEYSLPAAITTAAASKLVYSNDKAHVELTCRGEFDFDSCTFLKSDNTECFVAFTDEIALVCFRGTKGKKDWIANMNLASVPTDFGLVHGGFLGGFLDINQQIEDILDRSINGKPLIITGHSLGGALSTIAASEWRNRYNIGSIYTFGQPAVGDSGFRTSMEEFNSRYYRIVNDDDIVAKIPPGYKHVGRRIKLPSSRKLRMAGLEVASTEESLATEKMLSEIEFHLLQNQLDPTQQSVGNEGPLPSISDHFMVNYLDKLMRLMDVSGT